jgi:tetratricopeptide (TPR) repeat protein
LVFRLTKSRRTFYAQIERESFRTASDAIRYFEEVISLDRNEVGAHSHVIWCKLLTGPVEEIIPLVEQIIHLSPRDRRIAVWYYRIGRVHLLQSRTDEAILWLEKARGANPALAFVHAYLASAHALNGETERATAGLIEARRLSADGRYSSVMRLKATQYFGGP